MIGRPLAALLAAFLVSSTAHAGGERPLCGDRAEFVEKLKDGYAESPVSIGLAKNGSIIEVFAAASGSFSIIITSPVGTSCMVASGEDWQNKAAPDDKISL